MRTLALPCLTWKPAAAGDQPPPETTSSSPGTGCILGAPLPHLFCIRRRFFMILRFSASAASRRWRRRHCCCHLRHAQAQPRPRAAPFCRKVDERVGDELSAQLVASSGAATSCELRVWLELREKP